MQVRQLPQRDLQDLQVLHLLEDGGATNVAEDDDDEDVDGASTVDAADVEGEMMPNIREAASEVMGPL